MCRWQHGREWMILGLKWEWMCQNPCEHLRNDRSNVNKPFIYIYIYPFI